ncbi:hypothetical protein MKL20_05320, partial [Methylobacterium sp. E-066]|nr:hypothetical protein [Methylobacterium sp. E-066]
VWITPGAGQLDHLSAELGGVRGTTLRHLTNTSRESVLGVHQTGAIPDHHQAAALSGMAQFIGYVGAAFGPLLVGLLHEATGAWSAPMCLLVVASLLVMAFATRAGRSRFIGEA